MQHEERLRIWIEQGNVTISQLFFHHYKSLGYKRFGCNAHDAYDMHIKSEGNQFPTPTDFSARMDLTENEVSMVLQRLMQHGLLRIEQSEDAKRSFT